MWLLWCLEGKNMTAVTLSPLFNGWQGFDDSGRPLAGGLLYTYAAGTTTPLASYTTSSGNVENSNPIVLGSGGRPPNEIWLLRNASYKFSLQDSLSNPIATYDNINSAGASESFIATQGQTVFTPAGTYGAGVLLVSINGAVQILTTDYTEPGGTITFVTGLNAGDVVNVRPI